MPTFSIFNDYQEGTLGIAAIPALIGAIVLVILSADPEDTRCYRALAVSLMLSAKQNLAGTSIEQIERETRTNATKIKKAAETHLAGGQHDQIGSIEPGTQADLAVWRLSSLAHAGR